MEWRDFEDFLVADEGMSPDTVNQTLGYLQRAARDLGFEPDGFLSDPELAKVAGRRALANLRRAGGSNNAFNHLVRAINALARFGALREKRFEDVWFRMVKEPKPGPKIFHHWELRKVLAYKSPKRGWRGREETERRKALAWVGLFTAMRRSEIAAMRQGDLDPVNRTYTVRKPGKLGDPRTLGIEREFYHPVRPLMVWVRRRPIASEDPTGLWTKTLRDGRVRVLGRNEVGQELQELGQAVGLPANFNRSRHTRATALLRAGRNIRLVQRILGHSSIQTTARYLEMTDEEVRDELDKGAPPSPFHAKRRQSRRKSTPNDEPDASAQSEPEEEP